MGFFGGFKVFLFLNGFFRWFQGVFLFKWFFRCFQDVFKVFLVVFFLKVPNSSYICFPAKGSSTTLPGCSRAFPKPKKNKKSTWISLPAAYLKKNE